MPNIALRGHKRLKKYVVLFGPKRGINENDGHNINLQNKSKKVGPICPYDTHNF